MTRFTVSCVLTVDAFDNPADSRVATGTAPGTWIAPQRLIARTESQLNCIAVGRCHIEAFRAGDGTSVALSPSCKARRLIKLKDLTSGQKNMRPTAIYSRPKDAI